MYIKYLHKYKTEWWIFILVCTLTFFFTDKTLCVILTLNTNTLLLGLMSYQEFTLNEKL